MIHHSPSYAPTIRPRYPDEPGLPGQNRHSKLPSPAPALRIH